MKDPRLFRMTYSHGKVKFGGRVSAAGSATAMAGLLTIEVTNWDATEGWADVTAEFLEAAQVRSEVREAERRVRARQFLARQRESAVRNLARLDAVLGDGS